MYSAEFENMRQEILHLLRTQLEALSEPSGLSDAELLACYERQERVHQLRDALYVQLRLKEVSSPNNVSPVVPPPSSPTASAQAA